MPTDHALKALADIADKALKRLERDNAAMVGFLAFKNLEREFEEWRIHQEERQFRTFVGGRAVNTPFDIPPDKSTKKPVNE
jgi:hypothetical protein